MALQNGGFRLIGRWKSGPINFNLSKSGASASVKNKAGSFNILKPRYSSFKFAGIQLRGKKAANLQAAYLLITACIALVVFALQVAFFLAWLVILLVLFLWDLVAGFIGEFSDSKNTSTNT